MTGTAAMSGSDRQPPQVAGHRGDAVEHRLVHVDVEDHGAVGDLVARRSHSSSALVAVSPVDVDAEHGGRTGASR